MNRIQFVVSRASARLTGREGTVIGSNPLPRIAASGDEATYRPLAVLVTKELRDAILDGRLKPGMPIRQEAIARIHGTSRIPVREALRQLEAEGLVTIRPHSSARVATLDFEAFHSEHRLMADVLAGGSARAGEELVRMHIERSRMRLAERRELFDS